MVSSFGTELRSQLGRYLAEEVTLADLWNWLMPQAFDIDHDTDTHTARLAGEVQLLLFEYSDDVWTEAELRDRLRPLVTDSTTVLSASGMTAAATVSTGSSAPIIVGQVLGLSSNAGVSPAMASV